MNFFYEREMEWGIKYLLLDIPQKNTHRVSVGNAGCICIKINYYAESRITAYNNVKVMTKEKLHKKNKVNV